MTRSVGNTVQRKRTATRSNRRAVQESQSANAKDGALLSPDGFCKPICKPLSQFFLRFPLACILIPIWGRAKRLPTGKPTKAICFEKFFQVFIQKTSLPLLQGDCRKRPLFNPPLPTLVIGTFARSEAMRRLSRDSRPAFQGTTTHIPTTQPPAVTDG